MEKTNGITPFKHKEADHFALHYKRGITMPYIPGMWSMRYASQVAQFVTSNLDLKEEPEAAEAVSKLVFIEDFKTDANKDYMDSLHRAEARARNITNFVFETVLMIQSKIYGFDTSTEDLVTQRTTILRRLDDLKQNNNDKLIDMGVKVSGLELCCQEVWILDKISSKKAKELQTIITSDFGSLYYGAQIEFNMGVIQEIRQIEEGGATKMELIYKQSTERIKEYIEQLPETEKGQFEAIKNEVNKKLNRPNIKGK